jgi:glycosyltransferase involved in cell wall biosynthesis
MAPPLTIVLIAYNEEKHIAQTIESILSQSYRDFVVRIYNHASTDNTGLIADLYARKDERVEVTHLSVNNATKTIWRVIDAVTTPFFMSVAGHDLYHEKYVETCLEQMVADPRVVLSYSRAAFFNSSGILGVIRGNFDTRDMDALSRSLVVGYGLVYAYQWYGIYRTEYLKRVSPQVVVGGDHVMLAELATYGMFAEQPELLFFMRQNEGFGDQSVYIKKHYSSQSSDGTVQFLKVMNAYMRIADKCDNGIDKDLMKLAYFTQTLIRNRNILEMYGEDIHSFFAAEGIQDLRQRVADLVGAIELQFANYGIDTKSSKKE